MKDSLLLSAAAAIKALRAEASAERAKVNQWFFKTGKGEYGEGDKFLGVAVPDMRKVAKRCRKMPLSEILKLLHSPYNEARSLALLLLVGLYQRASTEKEKTKLIKLYLKEKKWVNNWNLVDGSAPYLLGDYLENRDHTILFRLAKSKSLWDRRIAIVSTWGLIRRLKLDSTFKLCELLMRDDQDLMHKACGWMLREAGKKDIHRLKKFLRKFQQDLPRTTLRYAIERFPETERKTFLIKTRI